ncbi:SIR2 family protein [Serinibacter salmoneus]|uniref:NAD(+) hydrolase ThsA n=1 Tax=Serinibacter salmoneus TaxID=556530 RepID=A0A2A9D4B9_9MICO|nr:SIR2 family protein [Serinibacter salmoneus]PFG20700.1 SIR2-like protein [Serinibacter salmoneus]
MTVTAKELVGKFAEAVAVGDAAVFIGAGTSVGAGLPDWNTLIDEARKTARVPCELTDAPLAAQYIANADGEGALHASIKRMIDIPAAPTEVHRALSHLPIRDYWTTNYDLLIEEALEARQVDFQWVVGEQDYATRPAAGTRAKRVTKMHGSLTRGETGFRNWKAAPIITRSDFERFEELHPITWMRLRASWLTNSFLFLGLSFDDPNLNLLLRLSRSLPEHIDAPPHYVVFTAKSDPVEHRLQQLRIDDLEHSGVNVHMMDSYSDLPILLSRLEVRCRPELLFVSGSFDMDDKSEAGRLTKQVAQSLAVALSGMDQVIRPNLVSFGGPAGQVVSRHFRDALSPSEYRPELVRFYYRKAVSGDESIPVDHRVGTAIFTERSLDEMRDFVFPQIRALVVIGGGARTEEEVARAQDHGVLVVPIGVTGGAARRIWDRLSPGSIGLNTGDELAWWGQLGSGSATLAAHAASKLIKRLMFE